jgi:glycosyltransferase involved in cell wall biosynthesis
MPDWWRRVATFDIGLAPLVDNRFNRSKSFIKILEYAALGVPFIASPVGPYADHVVDGVTGFLASTPDEWAERLDQLIRSPWLRMKIGGAARDWAAEWTTDRWIGKWEELYLNG